MLNLVNDNLEQDESGKNPAHSRSFP